MIKIAICDSEEADLKSSELKLKKMADKLGVDVEICAYKSGNKLLFDLEEHTGRCDILYIDVDMPAENGIKVAKSLRDMQYKGEIVFYTRNKLAVYDSFFVDPTHYVIKGETSEAKEILIFERAIKKANKHKKELITFTCAGENVTVEIREIRYFTVKGRIITVHYDRDDKQFEFYIAMERLVSSLCSKSFIRINRNTLINMEHVLKRTANEVKMKDGTDFVIGGAYKKEVKDEFKIFYEGRAIG